MFSVSLCLSIYIYIYLFIYLFLETSFYHLRQYPVKYVGTRNFGQHTCTRVDSQKKKCMYTRSIAIHVNYYPLTITLATIYYPWDSCKLNRTSVLNP